MIHRVQIYDRDEGEWTDSNEGPWLSHGEALRFATTEIGMPWRIVTDREPDHRERRRRLRVNGAPTTLGALYEVNRDMYRDDPDALRRLLDLEPGDDMRVGGGAMAETYILRCRDEPDPGSVEAIRAYALLERAESLLREAAGTLGDEAGRPFHNLSRGVREERERWNAGM